MLADTPYFISTDEDGSKYKMSYATPYTNVHTYDYDYDQRYPGEENKYETSYTTPYTNVHSYVQYDQQYRGNSEPNNKDYNTDYDDQKRTFYTPSYSIEYEYKTVPYQVTLSKVPLCSHSINVPIYLMFVVLGVQKGQKW